MTKRRILYICIFLSAVLFDSSVKIFAQGQTIDTTDYIPFYYEGALDYNLMIAASRGYSSEIERMFLMGADINAETPEGATPLIFAVSNGHPDAVNTLIRLKADINTSALDFESPLSLAVKKDFRAISESLIRNGAETSHSDSYGATPLHYASLYGYLTMVDILLYYDADIDARANDGTTPLMAAILAGNDDVADLLIQNGADAEAADYAGFTPFLIAAQTGNSVLLDLLWKKGVDIYEKNHYNWDALSLAIKANKPDAVTLLINNGNRWTYPGRGVVNPYNVAAKYRRRDMIDILRNNNIDGRYKPGIDNIIIAASGRFSKHDYISGFSLTFMEPLTNLGFTAGIDTKIWRTKVLVKKSENLYYQYLDKSSVVYCGITKDMNLSDNAYGSNFCLDASLVFAYSFGNRYEGTEIFPERRITLVPAVGIKWLWSNNLALHAGMELMKTENFKTGPLWGRIGLSYNIFLDNVRAPGKTIKWQ